MALRYLEQSEPNYIPTYRPLNPQMLSQVDSAIQQQGAQAQQYRRSQLDAAGEAYVQGISNLSEEDQAFARERFQRTQGELNNIVQNVGARGMMPYVDKEVSSLTTDLGFHKRASEIKAAAMATLEESPAPTDIRNYIAREGIGIKYDEETGRAIGIRGGYSDSDLNVAKNWTEFSKALDDFTSKAQRGNLDETTFASGGFSEVSASGQINDYRVAREYLDMDEQQAAYAGFLLSDPKMRQQLSLMAKAQGWADREPVTVDDKTGKVMYTFTRPKKTKDGTAYVSVSGGTTTNVEDAAREQDTETFASIEALVAANIASPFSQRDSYNRIKYITQKADTSKDSQGPRSSETRIFEQKIGFKMPGMEASDFIGRERSENQSLESQMKTSEVNLMKDLFDTGFAKEGSNMEPKFVNGELVINIDGTGYTKESIIDNYNTQIQSVPTAQAIELGIERDNLLNRIAAHEVLEQRSAGIERQLDSVVSSTRTELEKMYPAEVVNAITISDMGEVSFDTSKLTKPEEYFNEGEFRKPASMQFYDDPEDDKQKDLSGLQEGQIVPVYALDPKRAFSNYEKAYVTRTQDGEIKYIEQRLAGFDDVVGKAEDVLQGHVDDVRNAGEFMETIGVTLNPNSDVQKDVISMMEHDGSISPKYVDGTFLKADGTAVDADNFDAEAGDHFIPTALAMVDGEPTVLGYVASEGKNVPKEDMGQVYLQGTRATGIVRNVYGDEYVNRLAAEEIKQMFPELIDQKQTVTLSPRQLRNLTGGKYSNPLTIEYSIQEDSLGNETRNFVLSGDRSLANRANNEYDILREIYKRAEEE